MTKQEQIWKKFWKLYDDGEMTLNVAVLSAMDEWGKYCYSTGIRDEFYANSCNEMYLKSIIHN